MLVKSDALTIFHVHRETEIEDVLFSRGLRFLCNWLFLKKNPFFKKKHPKQEVDVTFAIGTYMILSSRLWRFGNL